MLENGNFDPNRTGKRYAILYAGTGNLCTLNDLEYCYRMLIGYYQFANTDVFVYYYSGQVETDDPANPATFWPSATTNDTYKMVINGAGTAENFRNCCIGLAGILQPNDLVFIHTNGHGGVDMSGEPCLLTFGTGGAGYRASNFSADLQLLPQHASMLVVMQQCYGGAFAGPLIAARNEILAVSFNVACASKGVAHINLYKDFSYFTEAWIDAHLVKDPFGNALTKKIDRNNTGFVEASEAYQYASETAKPFKDRSMTESLPTPSQDIILA